jgi:aminopeptidase N
MEFVYTDKIHPEWDLYEQFISQRWLSVMQNDAISFSHPVNMKVTHNDQLISIFDAITYSKGSSLLRMMRNFMGNKTFNRGISKYLSQHLYSTATQKDLWRILGDQMLEDQIQLPINTNLDDIMSTWTDQMGYPYVEIIRDDDQQILTISQRQFLFDSEAEPPKSPYNYLWSIPLKIKSSSSSLLTEIIWFSKHEMNMTINIQSNEWILVNPDLLGFFRTNYDRENWRKIIQQFKIDHRKFSIVERAGLIDDALNLARPSKDNKKKAIDIFYLILLDILPASLIFELLEYSHLEDSYIVWERILSGLQYIEQMITSSTSGLYLYERFRSYMVDLILPIYNKLGWEDNSLKDKWLDTLHRDMIISIACRYDLDHCIQRAQQLFEEWFNSPSNNNISANQRRVVYCTSIRLGDRARFQFLLREYQLSNDPQEKARIQIALTCTRDIELIRYLLDIHINLERNIIRRQDVLTGIRSICRNIVAETECWAFVRAKWTELFRDYGGSLSFADLIKDVTGRFNSLAQLEEFERFAEQITEKVCEEILLNYLFYFLGFH